MKARRTATRFEFYGTAAVLMIGLVVAELAATQIVAPLLGHSPDGGPIVSGLGLANIVIAYLMTDGLFKLLGMSRSGRTVEGRRPSVVPATAPVGPGEVIEVRVSKSLSNGIAAMGLVMSGLFGGFAYLVIPAERQIGREVVPSFLALLLAATALMFAFRFHVIIRVDARGITGYRKGWSVAKSFVPWDRVATCDVVAIRDHSGRTFLDYPVFKNSAGHVLFQNLGTGLAYTSPESRRSLLEYCKVRFPKLGEEDWSA